MPNNTIADAKSVTIKRLKAIFPSLLMKFIIDFSYKASPNLKKKAGLPCEMIFHPGNPAARHKLQAF